VKASSGEGAYGSLFFRNRLYPAVRSERRGVSALQWRKPKLKFSLPDQAHIPC
jgi:hypothetical protein